MATVGRNSPCPCGSGIKFKGCCDDLAKLVRTLRMVEFSCHLRRSCEARRPVSGRFG